VTEEAIDTQAQEIVSVLPRLLRQLFTIYTGDPALELPGAQMRVCTILRDGPFSMTAISRELGITLSAMTQIADRLERSGMVERVAGSCDRRCKSLKLTEHGTEVMGRRSEWRRQRVLRALEHLSPDQRESIIGSLNTLLKAAQQAAETSTDCQDAQLDTV
jgi:DNA-binding MarR family transcriptional regulator